MSSRPGASPHPEALCGLARQLRRLTQFSQRFPSELRVGHEAGSWVVPTRLGPRRIGVWGLRKPRLYFFPCHSFDTGPQKSPAPLRPPPPRSRSRTKAMEERNSHSKRDGKNDGLMNCNKNNYHALLMHPVCHMVMYWDGDSSTPR